MIKRKPTLMVTALMLVISVLLLSTASLAWFTLSTSPEISGIRVTLSTDRALVVAKDPEDPDAIPAREDFTQSIDLSDAFKLFAPLKPISTYDGVYWFRPAYNADGTLKDPKDFILADPAVNMNVSLYKEDGETMLTGKELFDAQNNGYYVSCEFWLATELEEDVTVTLSAPDRANNNLEKWETTPYDPITNPHGEKYGSYALDSYIKDVDENGKPIARPVDNNAQTTLRVGFMTDFETAAQKFTIYEPNADMRSILEYVKEDGTTFGKPTEANGYVYGYKVDPNTYKDGRYIPTLPIRVQKDADGNVITNAEGKPMGEVAALDPNNLIVQCQSTWYVDSLKEKVKNSPDDNIYRPTSTDVATFGKFISDTSSLNIASVTGGRDINNSITEGMDLASETQIVTLEGRDGETIHPKKVTMYIWVEGQDADCWNDIANGTFVVNLEFAAKEIEQAQQQ